ncbi:hypothetical protein [Helicobacter burdigaliensis]|uniref:hypothetical protein n=1 Tax=Helicobacter burdigaliensis TaxID=2315334 RepID=UPI001E470FA7|nr:hypothetical protein [Helicobacter burdigaliensis]
MPMQEAARVQYEILIFPLGEPLQIGVYQENKKIEEFKIQGHLSENLLNLYLEVNKKYPNISNIYFLRGPGSFMALKLIYLFVKTLEITKGIKAYACTSFEFNQNAPIKAYGQSYFVREKGEIVLKVLKEAPKTCEYILPSILDKKLFSKEIKPLYLLPAV